jgi:hypothetical protein
LLDLIRKEYFNDQTFKKIEWLFIDAEHKLFSR